MAAGIIRPYVRPEVTWIVEQHGLFQTYYYAHHLSRDAMARENFAATPGIRPAKDFCANWINVFDPAYSRTAEHIWRPRVREIFQPARRTILAFGEA